MMRGTGRTPDTSLYTSRPISAPKTRAAATTSSTTVAASTAVKPMATTKGATTTASANSRATAVSGRTTAMTAASSARVASAAVSVRSTRPAVPASRPGSSVLPVTTTSRLSRTTTSTAAAPAKPMTRTPSSARLFKSTTTASSSTVSRTAPPVRPTPAPVASRRLVSAPPPIKSQPVKLIADSNQNDLDEVESGYPQCMEIESFEDAVSATESAFSMLSGTGELNIITAVRLRPMSSSEKQKGYRRIADMAASEEGNWVRIVNPVALTPAAQYTPPQSRLPAAATSPVTAAETLHFPPQFTQEFHFDHTFWSFDRSRAMASQSCIYDDLGLFTIENALLGYNCSIFAYGQTSAGKTYTMTGSEAASLSGLDQGAETTTRRGLTPRICRGLFDRLTEESALTSDLDYSVHVSYIEIYYERAYDLLAQAATGSVGLTGKESLKVRESPETGVYVEHANQVRVTSFDDIKVLIDEGNRVRSVAATSANQRSSRSHAVLTLYLKQTMALVANSSSTAMLEHGVSSSGQLKKSKICLVDLAGSERADVSGANDVRLREAGSINKSLATLADVISALSRRATSSSLASHPHHEQLFVPYRNSILTRLLKESLGGNAKTIMLAAISPCCAHYDETLSTLKYIERTKSVVNVNVRVNASHGEGGAVGINGGSLDMIKALRREILELKSQQLRSVSPISLSVCSSGSTALVPSSVSTKKRALALHMDDNEPDGKKSVEHEPLPASESLDTGDKPPQLVKSPLYASSLCFDEQDKAKLEREVAKLRAQLRKKEREFELHEASSKALSDRVSAQVLKQQAHVINLLGLHTKFLGLAKLRALTQWRFSVAVSSKTSIFELIKPEAVPVPGVDKYVMTDSENNEPEESRGDWVSHSVSLKCPNYGKHLSEDKDDPACSGDEDVEAKPGLRQKTLSDTTSLFPQLEAKHRSPIVSTRGQVDVLCSSIVTDFFDDSSSLSLSTKKYSKVPEQQISGTKKASIKSIKSGNNNNQLSPDERNDPSDELALEIETDDDEEFEGKAAALIDEIIDHEAESNQVHNNHDSVTHLELDELDEPNDEDFDNGDLDEEECDDAELDSPIGSSSSPRASPSQRVQAKLARCLDAIDIARKAMGPTVRKLKKLTDESSSQLLYSSFQVGTGMERQLLAHADKALVVVNQHVTDLSEAVTSTTDSTSRIEVAPYDTFEGLLSDFCLQTLGHVCDGLTSGAAGTCSLARSHIEKQIQGFQAEVKALVSLALGSHESSSVTMGLLVLSLVELFGLGERIKFAWYAIDQKNRQRIAHVKQFALVTSSEPGTHLEVQARETQAQYDALLIRFEAQTSDFAKREEEDRLTLLLSTHRLEQEHDTRVSKLEQELEASHGSVTELQERLLAQMSHVELLEQELELTAVVRSTNELLLQHHHHGDSVSLSASPPSSSIIVKLEEELASALLQINELEANKGSVPVGALLPSSRRSSTTDVGAEPGVDGESVADEEALDETLADREMLEYMERTSEIEKQNNEAISKLNAAMGERRQQHLSATVGPAVASDLKLSSLEKDGRSGDDSTLARLKQELEAARARADVVEDQHMKLMVSFEHQTDTLLHLEEELYEAQVRGKLAEDLVTSLQERVSVLERELRGAQELADSLKSDMKDFMSELCVTECKCAELESACAELKDSCDASQIRVKGIAAELLEATSKADIRAIDAEHALRTAEKRCKDLKIENASLMNRCNELGHAATAKMESEALLSTDSTSRVDGADKRLAEVEAEKLELEGRIESLLEQLSLTQSKQEELDERWRLGEEHVTNNISHLTDDLEAERLSNSRLTEEIAKLKSEVGSLQIHLHEVEAAPTASHTLVTESIETALATSAQQIEGLMVTKQLLENEINSLSSELETTLERTLHLETQFADLLKLYEELQKTHEASEACCAELEAQVTERLETISSLEAQTTIFEQQRSEEKSQQADLKLQLSDARAQSAELESVLTKTKAEQTASQARNVDLKAQQLEIMKEYWFFRELSEAQKTKITSLTEELRAAYAQYDQLALERHEASTLAQRSQISDLESQLLTISSRLQSVEAEKVELSALSSSHVVQIQELEQECALKAGTIVALETDHSESIASCISLNNSISSLEEQFASVRYEREQETVEHQSSVASLELDLQVTNEQIAALQAAANQSARELEHRRFEAIVEHLKDELNEAASRAKHWEEQHETRSQEIQALQSNFEAKVVLLNAEVSDRELEARVVREAMERSQSSHSVGLKQQEARYNTAVTELHQEIERHQAVARDWELKFYELNACVSPDAVHKVRAQIEAAKAHADECEATYRVELENKLQLEFDLASVKKELHMTKQQLAELQCKELELNTKDPSGAMLRSQARQNELADMESERQQLQEKLAQISKREASVKLLEASANARFGELETQHEKRVRELEVFSKAEQAQAVLRVKDLETQLTKLSDKLCEASCYSSMQSEKLNQSVETFSATEQAQTLLRIKDLEANVTELAQKLVEANCRGDMQCEELHSFRSWSALHKLLSTEAGTMGAHGEEDRSRSVLDNDEKKLSPEARRLVLKHLNSLDTWFERAILGKISTDADRSERRASLLAIFESSDHSFQGLLAGQHRDVDEEEYDDDDGCIDASDADAESVELDDLGDELLAMCSVETSEQQQEPVECNDLDTIFDHDVVSRQFQEDARESRLMEAEARARWTEPRVVSTNPFDNYCLDARDSLSEVAQLRLTVLKLKQVLDAKEEAMLFLDDKMRYYEELLAITTSSCPPESSEASSTSLT